MKSIRIANVRENMRREGFEAIIVSAPASVAYLTGEWVHPGERMLALVISASGQTTLVANRMFALKGVIKGMDLVEYGDTDDAVEALSPYLPGGRVGIDKTWPAKFLLRLMELRDDITPALGSGPVDDARMVKDGGELDALRESSRLNDLAVGALMREVRAGATERELCARYVEIARSLGADGPSFEPLICFGANCAEPHHAPGDTELKDGDSIIIDVGLSVGGGFSDMTRTMFMGRAGSRFKEVYHLVLEANRAGRAAVKPGVLLSEIDAAARGVIERGGYGEYFIHRTGHGIGMEVHEPPDVSATSDVVARPGMVFSIEPGIYLPGEFGVRIEDLVAVTDTGCEVLNSLDRSLQESGAANQ